MIESTPRTYNNLIMTRAPRKIPRRPGGALESVWVLWASSIFAKMMVQEYKASVKSPRGMSKKSAKMAQKGGWVKRE